MKIAFVVSLLFLSGCAGRDAPSLCSECLNHESLAAVKAAQTNHSTTTVCAEEAPCPPGPHDSVAGFFSTHFSTQAWHDDVVCGYLTKPPVIEPAIYAGAALLVLPFDHEISNAASGTLGNNRKVGDYAQYAAVAVPLLAGVIAPGAGRSPSDETWNQAEAFALTTGIEVGLKATVARHRPDMTSSTSSFPSGHATAAFCGAALAMRNSGPWLGIPIYGLAALTAYSRVEVKAHFPSDVLAGAAIGTLGAGAIDALHFGTGHGGGPGIARRAPRFDITPLPDERGCEVGVTVPLR